MEGGAAGDELDTGGDGHQHETVDYSLSFPTETVPLYTVHVQYIHYVYVHVTQVYVYTYMYNYAHLDARFVVCHTYKKLANVLSMEFSIQITYKLLLFSTRILH